MQGTSTPGGRGSRLNNKLMKATNGRISNVSRSVIKGAVHGIGSALKGGARIGFSKGGFLVAGVAMMAAGMVKGFTNQSKDLVYERYVQDYRYSRNMLYTSRVGVSMGTKRARRYGSTDGLSNALSMMRHGR
jgi:hypothetical protein